MNKYYKMEASVLQSSLDIYEKVLYSIICSFEKCYYSNPQLQEFLSCNEKTITRKLSSLVDKKLISIHYNAGKKRYVRKNDYAFKSILKEQIDSDIESVLDEKKEEVIPTISLPDSDSMSTPSNIIYKTRLELNSDTPVRRDSARNLKKVEVPDTGGFFSPESEKSLKVIENMKCKYPTEEPKNEIQKINIPTERENVALQKKKEPVAPKFLTDGIMYDGQVYYPLSMRPHCGKMSTEEYSRNKKIGKNLLRALNKVTIQQQSMYMDSKQKIIETGFMAEHKNILQELDFQRFLDFLTELNLPEHQKKNLIPHARIIKHYIDDSRFYEQALKNIKLNFGCE